MKKIYMILAVFALLSMSLNAQNTSTLTFTAKCNGSGTADDGAVWTVTSNATESNFDNSRGIHYGTNSARVQYINLTTSDIPGTITSVVVNASRASGASSSSYVNVTVGGATFGNGQQTISTTATNYTFTGSATGEIIVTVGKPQNGTGALYCKSITVTYEVDDSNTATLDLFSNTTDANMCLPVYGGYHDHTQHNQMVYPASLLTDMVGKKIKSMTFYPASVTYNGTTYSGIGFRNGSVTFKMMEVTGSTGFDSSNPSFITGSMTTVKTVTMPSTAQTSATTWKITFDQEYEYNGGDLVIDVTNATGDYQRTYFYTGTTSIAYPGYYTYSGSEGNASVAVDYVPKVTFTYDNTSTSSITITPEAQTINDAAPGALTVTGTDIEGNISVSAGTNWSVDPTSLSSTGGSVSVSYTGTDLSASTTVTASATGATDATATVNYVADLYIVTDNGVTGNWDFTTGTHMTYDNGVYTATFTATADNTFILFARMLGNNVDWNTRYVFGPDSNGDWLLPADGNGNGNIDVNDDDPIHIQNPGVYVVTINANDGTFTITKAKTADPVITYEVNGDNVVITATGDGTVTLNVPGYEPATGNGSASITVPRTDTTYSVTATATAQESGKDESDPATETITIPFLQTATPTITYTTQGENVIITATATAPDADAEVTLTVGNGEPVIGTGSVSVTVPCGVTSTTVTATATAKVDGKAQSETATEQVPIPAGTGWIEMYGTYNNPGDYLSMESLEVDDEGNQKEIMLVDQFLASTLYNDHTDKYTYTMRETVNNEEKSSNAVNIPVYKTSSTMQGFYTQGQVDTADLKMELKPQIINSAMYYDVHPEHSTLYYSLYRGLSAENEDYPVIDEAHRVSQLQKYEEMVGENNVQYFMFENHQKDVTPRYDHLGDGIAERIDTAYVQGVYNDEIAYVPVIWTYGLYTGRDQGDGKNNSYGSDIKREKLGKTEIVQIGGSFSGGNNQENTGNGWEGYFYKDGVQYYIFTPVITIEGTTPEKYIQHDRDTSVYVPYMYRAWCLYDGAIDFGHNSEGVLVGGDPIQAPFLLGQELVTDPNVNRMTIGKDWNGGPRLQNSFAVPRSIQGADLQFAVRFYYKKVVTQAQAQAPNTLRGNRDGNDEEEEYYIVEDTGNGNSIPVMIEEFLAGKTVTGVTYVNSLGMQSDKPFDGLNIIVTRYSDGTTSTTKVMR